MQARYPGVITELRAEVGDFVHKGDVLAVVESNASLQHYDISTPISGLIVERPVNVGELTSDTPMFRIINDQSLWAELNVFPGQRAQIRGDQPVTILHQDHAHKSRINHIVPTSNAAPSVHAVAVLKNENQDMSPGELVSGRIVVETIDAALVVENRALQHVDNQSVVFVNVDAVFEPRPLLLGRTDGTYTEVLDGLEPGDRYVVDNSYLIKADLEKSAAAHQH